MAGRGDMTQLRYLGHHGSAHMLVKRFALHSLELGREIHWFAVAHRHARKSRPEGANGQCFVRPTDICGDDGTTGLIDDEPDTGFARP